MLSKSSHPLFPVICLLFGATLWGIIWYPLRLLEDNGLAGLWTSLIIYGAAFAVGLLVLIMGGHKVNRPGPMLLLAYTSGWCNIAFILAILDGNVVRVLLLFYLSPLWTVLLGRIILKEQLSKASIITLLFAMAGALIMLWDSKSGYPWPQDWTDWLAISSGMAFSISNIVVRMIQNEGVWIKTTATWWGVASLAVVLLLIEGAPLPEATMPTIGMAIVFGAAMVVVMTLAVLYGVTRMPVHRSAVILLFELVAGAISAQLLTDEVVQTSEWFGGLLIITAAWFAARGQLAKRGVGE